MPSKDSDEASPSVRVLLDRARIDQQYVRIKRRAAMDEVTGYVMDVGSRWALVAVLTEGREPNGYEVLRLRHVKRVKNIQKKGDIDRRVLEARGLWPLSSISVNLDRTGPLLDDLTALEPVLMFHTEEKWPDMAWVGSLCRREGKRTWYHALDPQAQWLRELESFKTRRPTRISVGNDYVAGLVLVAGSSPLVPTQDQSPLPDPDDSNTAASGWGCAARRFRDDEHAGNSQ